MSVAIGCPLGGRVYPAREGQLIADVSHGEKEHGTRRLRLDLLPQLSHCHVEALMFSAVLWSPHGLQQFSIGHHLVRMRDEISQQVELFRCEMDRATVTRDNVTGKEIDHHVSQREAAGGLTAHHGRATKRHTDAGG